MAKRLTKVKKSIPDLEENSPAIVMAEEADTLADLVALTNSDGGKELVRLLLKDVLYCVGKLRGEYKTATHAELIALVALLDANLGVVQLLFRSKEALKVLDEQIEDLLQE